MSGLLALLLFIFIKKFLFDIIRVNNEDMADSFHKGDVLLIQKKFFSLTHKDVIYLKHPISDSSGSNTYFIQRILGMPGDSIELRDKNFYLNSMLLPDSSSYKHNYFIKTNRVCSDSLLRTRFSIFEGGRVSEENDFSYALQKNQAEIIKADSLIQSIELRLEKPGQQDEVCFPFSETYLWNSDYFGKLYIPKKGDSIVLNSTTIDLYATIISEYEQNALELRQDSVFVNSQYSRYYLIRQNYYFVLGDNRDNANDSRHWGFLPEANIAGKVLSRLRKVNP